MGIVFVCAENRVVAIGTAVHTQMYAVTEGQCPEIRYCNGNLVNRMTGGAFVQLWSTEIILIMTGAA